MRTIVPKENDALCAFNVGNGQLRATAANVTLMLMVKLFNGKQDYCWHNQPVADLLQSLFSINASYELHGDGSERAALIAQLARQNQDSQAQPVSFLQWIELAPVHLSNATALSDAKLNRRSLVEALSGLVNDYHQHPDVLAYDECGIKSGEPKPKRHKSGTHFITIIISA